ncbi:hypothetical protein SUNI508_01970 [Seiridium unicorne]|uniref:Uncharacterized protein n=1 Tax=Seiridium unicorne TaxID=138068 RepID=A0ABR2UKR2_9PEZI
MANRSTPMRLVEWQPGAPNKDQLSYASRVRNFEFLNSKESVLPVARKRKPSGKATPAPGTVRENPPRSPLPGVELTPTKSSADKRHAHSVIDSEWRTRPRFNYALNDNLETERMIKDLPIMSTENLLLLRQHVDIQLAQRQVCDEAATDGIEDWDILDEDEALQDTGDQFHVVDAEDT